MNNRLRVRVNGDLTLDAGHWQEAQTENGPVRLVHPPEKPMFDQLLAYLESLPDPGYHPLRLAEEATVAVAVCLRWGSYLAALLDAGKPVWSQAANGRCGRISDGEMARINIEASYALSRWIELMREDYWGKYLDLMHKARLHLPMPQKRVSTNRLLAQSFAFLAGPIAAVVGPSADLGPKSEQVRKHPTRTLANSLVHTCWRNNSPAEDIHSGRAIPLPLTWRRLAPKDERALIRGVGANLAAGLKAVQWLVGDEGDGREWYEKVLPFGLTPFFSPAGWSLSETSRPVRLLGAEPE